MLSDADREWVKAIVQAAVERAAFAIQERCASRVDEHERACPNVRYAKMLLIGAGIGIAVVATNGVINLANALAALIP